MKIEVHVHTVSDPNDLYQINRKLDLVVRRTGAIVAKIDELSAELGEINATTNELAADVDQLLLGVPAEGGLSAAEADAHKQKLVELKDALKGIAAKYPVSTEEPPVDPVDPAGRGRR